MCKVVSRVALFDFVKERYGDGCSPLKRTLIGLIGWLMKLSHLEGKFIEVLVLDGLREKRYEKDSVFFAELLN